MDITIRRILGENEDESDIPERKPEAEQPSALSMAREESGVAEDPEAAELANLWVTGNKHEVVNRFMEMDNESSVNLVFAIGHEGALELAIMADQMTDQSPEESGAPSSAEPEYVERGPATVERDADLIDA